MRRLLPILSLVSLTACYSYARLDSRTPSGGLYVSATLTDRGTADLGNLIGFGVGEVEGTVISANDQALTLSLRVVRQRSGIETDWKGESVVFPREVIASLRERHFSRGKTAIIAGASATGLAIMATVFGNRGNGGGQTVGGGGSPK